MDGGTAAEGKKRIEGLFVVDARARAGIQLSFFR
jgi:hypothetical protein